MNLIVAADAAWGIGKDGEQMVYIAPDLKRFRRFPRYMEETTRIFNEYPAMARDIMLNLFKVDGHPQARIKDKLLGPLKRVGLWRVAQDGRKGMKAL